MKYLLLAAMVTLLITGCDNSNPIDQQTTANALFSEESMYKTTLSTDVELSAMKGGGPAHDSVRHGRMLGHLKTFVALSDEQFDSVKSYAGTMFASLKNIRTQVRDSVITRIQAQVLVVAARAEFIASVTLILTQDQLPAFERWVAELWNKPPKRRGHGGPGGRGGPGHGGRP